jgi:hypothetical protein
LFYTSWGIASEPGRELRQPCGLSVISWLPRRSVRFTLMGLPAGTRTRSARRLSNRSAFSLPAPRASLGSKRNLQGPPFSGPFVRSAIPAGSPISEKRKPSYARRHTKSGRTRARRGCVEQRGAGPQGRRDGPILGGLGQPSEPGARLAAGGAINLVKIFNLLKILSCPCVQFLRFLKTLRLLSLNRVLIGTVPLSCPPGTAMVPHATCHRQACVGTWHVASSHFYAENPKVPSCHVPNTGAPTPRDVAAQGP